MNVAVSQWPEWERAALPEEGRWSREKRTGFTALCNPQDNPADPAERVSNWSIQMKTTEQRWLHLERSSRRTHRGFCCHFSFCSVIGRQRPQEDFCHNVPVITSSNLPVCGTPTVTTHVGETQTWRCNACPVRQSSSSEEATPAPCLCSCSTNNCNSMV